MLAKENSMNRKIVMAALAALTVAATSNVPAVTQLDVARISELLDFEAYIVSWFSDLVDHALSLLRSGIMIPGYKEVQVQVRRRWRPDMTEAQVAAELSRITGSNLKTFLPPSIVGIGEAEKALKEAYKRSYPNDVKAAAKAATEAMANLTLKDTSGNTTIVKLDDKRPAVTAQSLFAGVTLEGTVNKS